MFLNTNNRIGFGTLVLFVLLFLACFNFLGRGPVFFLLFSLYGVVYAHFIRWTYECLLYFILTFFSCIASVAFYELEELFKCTTYFFSFYAGYCFYNKPFPNKTYVISGLLFSGALGFITYLVYIAYLNFILIGHTSGVRMLINPWTSEPLSVTLVGLLSCVAIVYSVYWLFCRKQIIMKALGGVLLVFSLWVNVQTATRTPFLLAGILYAFIIYDIIWVSKAHKRFVLLFAVLIIGFCAYLALSPSFEVSAIGDRFSDEGLNTTRWDIMRYYYSKMYDFPWGGGFAHQHYEHMPHNILQEAYDLYGCLFTLVLTIIMIGMLKRFIKLHRIKKKSQLVFLLEAFYICAIILLALEPIITGYPQLLWFIILIDGIVAAAIEDKRNSVLRKI